MERQTIRTLYIVLRISSEILGAPTRLFGPSNVVLTETLVFLIISLKVPSSMLRGPTDQQELLRSHF